MAFDNNQQLGRRGTAAATDELICARRVKCRKNSFFPASGRPERMFEIQPVV
jgi:hypothetical protein